MSVDSVDRSASALARLGEAVEVAASRSAWASGVQLSSPWEPVGFYCTPDRQAVFGYEGGKLSQPLQAALRRFHAESIIVVPIAAGGHPRVAGGRQRA
ncbi:MAG: hypothetical protein ACYDEN_06325 [Acidimicrobiales bacterium]